MSNWIKVEDRLPDHDGIFIATMLTHLQLKEFMEPLHYIDGQWLCMYDQSPLTMEYEVTHWQDLPDFPED